jgi:hypothetical protein
MHKKLYDEYEEFYENRWKHDTKRQTETRVIDLFRRGYTPEEVEKLLAEEDKSE